LRQTKQPIINEKNKKKIDKHNVPTPQNAPSVRCRRTQWQARQNKNSKKQLKNPEYNDKVNKQNEKQNEKQITSPFPHF
jgi:hypothetical protein